MVENGQKWLKRSKMAVLKGFWSKRAVLEGGAWGVPRGSLKRSSKSVLMSIKSIKSALKGKKMVKKC